MKSLADHLREIPSDLKQFLKDCWYAPLWLKLTNGLWIAIVVSMFWISVSWILNIAETTNPDPHTWESTALGMTFMFFPFIFVVVLFTVKFIYEWVARKVLTHFGFIELKE